MTTTLETPETTRSRPIHLGRTATEWAVIEAEEHNEQYTGQTPFGLDGLEFTIEHALWYEDYCFKKGRRRDRGHRTKKFLQLVDLASLEGKRVLDIGCGIGQYSVLCAKAGAHVTGVELSSVGVETARKMAEANGVADRCTFVNGDVTEQSFDDDSFDVVLMHEVLHHAIKYPGLKDLILRIAAPGAKIVIADTVQGAWPIHFGRKVVKFCRYFGQPEKRRQEEDLGDVLFTTKTYETFAEGFRKSEIHRMSFFFMVKQTALQWHTDRWYVRALLRAAHGLDRVLLTLVPPLKSGCGEAILYLER
ncbi:MAG: class I SAM-dependent methyltransferase [Planctomycetota bacterium]